MKKAPVAKHQARCLRDVGHVVGCVAAWAATRPDIAGVCVNLTTLAPNGRVILDVRIKAAVPGRDGDCFVFVVHFSTEDRLSYAFVRQRLKDEFDIELALVLREIEAGSLDRPEPEPGPATSPKPKPKAKPRAAAKKGGRR